MVHIAVFLLGLCRVGLSKTPFHFFVSWTKILCVPRARREESGGLDLWSLGWLPSGAIQPQCVSSATPSTGSVSNVWGGGLLIKARTGILVKTKVAAVRMWRRRFSTKQARMLTGFPSTLSSDTSRPSLLSRLIQSQASTATKGPSHATAMVLRTILILRN